MDQRPGDFLAPRLSATMASQRLLVLDFVRGYIERWSDSPSLGEIGAALNIDRTRVRRAIRSLADDGLLRRTPGPRGLALPCAEQEAVRQLRAMGWTVYEAETRVTKATLLPPPALDYPGFDREGDRYGGTHDGPGNARKKSARKGS